LAAHGVSEKSSSEIGAAYLLTTTYKPPLHPDERYAICTVEIRACKDIAKLA
jgi:hypothetical protein